MSYGETDYGWRRSIKFARLFLASLASIFCGVASAGPLDDFAMNNGGTQPQVAVSVAVQTICPQLIGAFGGLQNALDAPESPDKDITLRCNELVQSAVDFNDPNATPPRTLAYSDPNQLLSALQEVNGEEIAAQNTMTTRAANSQVSNIAARLGALRMATMGAGTTGAATAFNFDVNEMPVFADVDRSHGAALGGGASADGGINPLGWFVNGSWNTGDWKASDVENGFDFDAFGLTAGLDYRFARGVIGGSIGYDDFKADFKPSPVVTGGDVQADGFAASIFGLAEFGNFFIDGIGTLGKLDYKTSRFLVYPSNNTDPNCQCSDQSRGFESKTDGDYYMLSATAGWQAFARRWLFQPTVGLSARKYNIDGFIEQDLSSNGGMELRYGDQDIKSLRSTVGLQISRSFNQSFGVIRPTLTADWYHEFEDDQAVTQAKYAQEDALANANPGGNFSNSLTNCLSCFSILGVAPDKDYGVIGAGLSFVFPRFVQLLFYYEGLVGYQDLSSHAFSVNLRGQF